ncbi:MAG: hypothetical protein CMO74_15025 [Verrucomicrobiales bacterium]|nr:hypothetical protein [Verrucomicrobiales bacterium]
MARSCRQSDSEGELDDGAPRPDHGPTMEDFAPETSGPDVYKTIGKELIKRDEQTGDKGISPDGSALKTPDP